MITTGEPATSKLFGRPLSAHLDRDYNNFDLVRLLAALGVMYGHSFSLISRPEGGTSSIIGISNAYNAVPIACGDADTTVGWTYATASWRVADNSTANSVSIINALGQGSVELTYGVMASNNTIGDSAAIGVSQIDSQTSVFNFGAMSVSTGTTANNYQQLSAHWGAYADLGYHVFYPLENCAGGTCTYDLSGGTMSFVVSTTY